MLAPHFHLGPVRNEADTDEGNQDLKELLYFDLLDRGIYIARRGMMVTNVVHDEAAYAALETAIEDFVRVRQRLLAG